MTVARVRRAPEATDRPRGGIYRALDFSFSVEADDNALAHELRSALTSLHSTSAGWPEVRYTVSRDPETTFTLSRDTSALQEWCTASEVIEWLLWDVNRSTAEASSRHLLLHAGAVELNGAGVLLPGVSGAGKSTMVAALVIDGFGYLTDEMVGLSGWEMVPFHKPISLDRRSMSALGLRVSGERQNVVVPADELRAGSLAGECPPKLIVIPSVDTKQPTSMKAIDPADAMLELTANCVNLPDHGGPGIRLLAGMASDIPCHRLTVSDLGEACRLIRWSLA